MDIQNLVQQHETPLTKFTIEPKKEHGHKWFEVTKYNEWKDGSTLILEWTTHETREQAEEQDSKNKDGFWGTL